MSDIYSHDGRKFSDAGLQLRVPVDLVPPNQFSRLTNCTPIIEGRLEARAALKWVVNVANTTSPGSGLHSLVRLNQSGISVVGDRIAGIDTTVQTYALPAGNVAVSRDTNRTGDPLSMPNFHFNADSPAWQLLADRQGMLKYRGGSGTGYYGALGVYAPQNPVAAINVGAAGNPNNGAGPQYDWLYTHVFTPTLSESNPSFPAYIGNEDVIPNGNTSPETGFGGSAASVHTNTTGTLIASSATETRQSCLWSPWNAPASTPYQLLYLDIIGSFVVTGTSGAVYGAIYFTTDGGITWRLYVECSMGTVNFGIPGATSWGTIQINPAQDFSLLQVRAVVLGCGNSSVPQNVTARRIRDRAGNFNISDLLVGANATNSQITLTITGIHTHGAQSGAAVQSLALVNQQANICIIDPRTILPTFPCDAVRLYRRGGSITASWAFVNQYSLASLTAGACGANQLQLNDNIADANLGDFISFLNDAPVTSVYVIQRPLPYIWGPAFNPSRMFGCGDPDRPDAVYFCNAGNADQWGVGQWIDTSSPSDPMQNGCVFNTRSFAFSKERMFELTPSLLGGATVTPFQTSCSRGLISPWGLLATARMIYFVAKDGIYMTSGGEEESLVENDIKPLFPTLDNPLGRSVNGYDPVDLERIEDIRLRFHNDELYFIYRGLTEGQLNMLVYDQNKRRWRAASYPVHITTAYSEEGTKSSLLLGDSLGNMYSTQTGTGDVLQASTIDIPVTIRTGAYDQGLPLNQKEYGNVLFDIDPGGATAGNPVTITPLLNGEVITAAAITVTGTGRQQVPLTLGDVFGFNIEFQITFVRNAAINPILYQFEILWRTEPAAITHWEARETDNGLIGWQHLRDANIAIRSTTNVTLTLTFDSTVTQTHVLASTGGLRKKVYVPFHANKFKLVRYSLDSTDVTQPFRIYEPDLEVRAKQWLTSLGYAVVKPFGGEAPQATEALEAQLLGGK